MCTERDFNLIILSKLLNILECLHPLKILIMLRNKENGDSLRNTYNSVYSSLIIEQYYKSNHVYAIFSNVCRTTISIPFSCFIFKILVGKRTLNMKCETLILRPKGKHLRRYILWFKGIFVLPH